MQELEAEDDLLSKVPVRYVHGRWLFQPHLSPCVRNSGISRRNLHGSLLNSFANKGYIASFRVHGS